MGAYLSKPVTEKISKDEQADRLSYGASSMQGWRVSQEDSHNCIIEFDVDTSLFAVYDGHGGAEVAVYCSKNLPDCIRSMADYKKGRLGQALENSFLEFDASLTKPEVITELKQIAGLPDSDDESVEDTRMLREEALLPLDEVLTRYESSALKKVAPHVGEYEKPKSPMLRGKKDSMDQNGLPGSSKNTDGEVLPVNGEVDVKDIEKEDKSVAKKETEDEPGCSDVSQLENSSERKNKTVPRSGKHKEMDLDKSSDTPELNSDNKSEEPELNVDRSEEANVGLRESSEKQKSSLENDCDKDSSEEKRKSSKEVKASLKTNTENVLSGSEEKSESCNKESAKKDLVEAGCSTAGKKDKSKKKRGSYSLPKTSSSDDDSEEEEDDKEYSVEHDSSSAEASAVEEEEEKKNANDDEEEAEEDGEDEDSEDDEDEEEESEESDEDEEGDFGMVHSSGEENPGADSGCTAVLALLRGDQLYVANAGDSRCVVCRGGKAINMSFDHKPEDDIERTRIVKAGGNVTSDGRVNGGLNLSRAIGDHSYKGNTDLSAKEQMISALPDIQTLVIDPKEDTFMVLACDGIWNSMSSQEVVDFIVERIDVTENLSTICEELFDHCLAPHTYSDGTGCDNMTAIIVKFTSLKKQSNKRQSDGQEVLDSKKLKVQEDICSE